jgi:Type VI secretion system effector, Hcp
MSTDKIDPNKNPTEVPPKKTELTDEALSKVTGGAPPLTIGNNIKGESTDDKHKDWIEISSF